MKYLLVDNEIKAAEKSARALDKKYPEWRTKQQELHDSNPAKYPHPDNCAQYLHPWQQDELGRCELHICDDTCICEECYCAEDCACMTDTPTIIIPEEEGL